MCLKNEIWKDITNYEGLYQVSNFGRVKSLKRIRKSKNNSPSIVNERILSQKNTKGYKSVSLSKNSKLKTFSVHRLVAQSFLDNPNNLPQINHKDENKTNNMVDNLEWCDAKYNTNYSIYKISKKIKYNGKIFSSIRDCGRQMNMDPHHIRYYIINNKPYKSHYFEIL